MRYVITILVSIITMMEVMAEHDNATLLHIKGQQSAGARFGKGTKNKFDIGLEYERCFTNKIGLICQLDMEKATFGNSEFSNQFLMGTGIELVCFHPAIWMFIDLNLMGNVGYDKWTCEELEAEKSGIVGGSNIGASMEIHPTQKFAIVAGAQEYLLFGNDTHYLKPNFYLGVRYVWDR